MICAAPNQDGYDVVCQDEDPHHRGPHHAAGGGPGVVGMAWCTLPCRGRGCAGPCHPLDGRAPKLPPTGGENDGRPRPATERTHP